MSGRAAQEDTANKTSLSSFHRGSDDLGSDVGIVELPEEEAHKISESDAPKPLVSHLVSVGSSRRAIGEFRRTMLKHTRPGGDAGGSGDDLLKKPVEALSAPASTATKPLQDNWLSAAVVAALDSVWGSVAMLVVTMFALFGDDVRAGFASPSADNGFYGASFAALLLYSLELCANSFARPGYAFRFYFWLDLVSSSMMCGFPVGWIWEAVFSCWEGRPSHTQQQVCPQLLTSFFITCSTPHLLVL